MTFILYFEKRSIKIAMLIMLQYNDKYNRELKSEIFKTSRFVKQLAMDDVIEI